MKELKVFLNKFATLAEPDAFVEAFSIIKKIKKKDFLLEPGVNCNYLAFIRKGTFRVFFYDQEGVEVTVWFSWEGMLVGDLLAFYKKSKSIFYVQAIEESELSIISREKLEDLYIVYPDYLQFARKYAEHVSVNVMERLLTLQTKSAEERYLELLETPNFLQKIPLKYLASYIGITDSSLSRIRRNVR
ncbi:MAG: Crp/Fnr family transcriptional regulator [Bacteroidia bacterium]|nr:Crp/Fnr family transcriptional regulator [Bacteroidia bacterium]